MISRSTCMSEPAMNISEIDHMMNFLHQRVYDDTVSGALETAAIAPSACRPPPPAAVGHPIAPCGIVLTASRIASPSRRFCGLSPAASTRPLHLYKPGLAPSNDHALFSSLFPLLSSSPGALPPSQDATLPDDCPFSSMTRSTPLSSTTPLFPFSSDVTDGSSGRLHRKLSHFFHP